MSHQERARRWLDDHFPNSALARRSYVETPLAAEFVEVERETILRCIEVAREWEPREISHGVGVEIAAALDSLLPTEEKP